MFKYCGSMLLMIGLKSWTKVNRLTFILEIEALKPRPLSSPPPPPPPPTHTHTTHGRPPPPLHAHTAAHTLMNYLKTNYLVTALAKYIQWTDSFLCYRTQRAVVKTTLSHLRDNIACFLETRQGCYPHFHVFKYL